MISEANKYTLENMLKSAPIVLYGAGFAGAFMAHLLVERNIYPLFIFDNDKAKQGKKIAEIEVVKPNDTLKDVNPIIIICILSKNAAADEIELNLLHLGYKNILHILDLKQYENSFSKQDFLIFPNKKWQPVFNKECESLLLMLADELSRKTVVSNFDFLYTNKTNTDYSLPIENQYFAFDLFNKSNAEVFYDCGAFKGKILERFSELWHNEFCKYYAFEPDEKYLSNIQSVIEQRELQDKAEIFNVALGQKNEQLKIRNFMSENSIITADGEKSCECVTMDSIQDILNPTFIKIDVEGFEMSLLNGAKRTILQSNPIIAIAIYHNEKDLWEIPFYIHKLLPNHKLFIRSYSNWYETILYAIPPERLIDKGQL